MASPKFKVLRRLTGAAGAPAAMTEGEIAANFVDNKVYIHNGTSAIPVAGKGEFVDLGSEQSVTGKKNFTAATVSTAPADANDLVRKTDLDTEVTAINAALTTETNARIAGDDALGLRIDALGSAFNYVGTVSGGANSGAATNLASLTQKDAGDYYKVAAAGYFVLAPAAAFYANANDGLVFNLAAGVDLIDNTNSSVSGTANEIEIIGSSDTGYTVALDAVFSGRMTTAESDIDSLEGRVTTAESDIDALEGRMSTAESDIDALEGTVGALGTMATQNADSVAITGGTINGTTIGGTTAAAGSFTTLSASSTTTLAGASFSGNLVGNGTTEITDFVIDAGTF